MTNTQKSHIRMWVKALRSGKYQQGRGQLKTSGGRYCCLGVACEVYRIATKKGRWRSSVDEESLDFLGNSMGLPPQVVSWLGLPAGMDDVELRGSWAAVWNDRKKASFKKIATLIEKEFLQS